MKQAEIARLCGVSPQAWNNAETGDNRIGVDNAMAIWLRTGADLNYIYGGEPAGLHHALAKEIERLESAVPTAKRA